MKATYIIAVLALFSCVVTIIVVSSGGKEDFVEKGVLDRYQTNRPLTCGRFENEEGITDSVELGVYGTRVWGEASNFVDSKAKWVWSSEFGTGDNSAVFVAEYTKSSSTEEIASLHIHADNVAIVELDGDYIQTVRGGWNDTAYPKIEDIAISPGTHVFKFTAKNLLAMSQRNPAGLLYSLVRNTDNKVVMRSGECTKILRSKHDIEECGEINLNARDVVIFGRFGISPWGTSSEFVDPQAEWVWSAARGENVNNATLIAQYINWTNTSEAATLHIIADNIATVDLDGIQIASVAGGYFKSQHGDYPRIDVSLSPGKHTFTFRVSNIGEVSESGNPAALLYAVVRDSDSAVVMRSGRCTTVVS